MSEKTKLDLLTEVITANRELEQKARQLNIRAGHEVFKVKTRQEWEEWLGARLFGAVSVATIPDVSALKLPALDEEIINLVMQENPDTIEVLGQTCKVEYRSETQALVRIDFRGEQAKDWLKLPDEIRLPGGREVSLYSAVEGYGYYIEAKSSLFKAKVRECLNQGQWDNWRNRPTITIPDLAAEDASLPEIASMQYGACVVTGEPLVAFGTLTAYRIWSSDPITWKAEWFRTRVEAEAKLESAKAEFAKAKVEAREKAERETAKAAAETAREELKGLSTREGWNDLEYELRREVEARTGYYACLPEASAELREWTAQTKVIFTKVEAAITEGKQKKAENSAALRKLAWPVLRLGEQESEGTVYGMPCNEDGPCEEKSATVWRLYSFRDGDFLRHKGYRSSSFGSTFAELVCDYMRGEPDLAVVLQALPAEARRKGELAATIEAVGNDVETARRAKAFAEAVLQCCGGKVSRALQILESELTAPYGRARRQDAIQRNLPGIGDTEAGQRFLGHGRASDVDTTLAGAVAWLKSQAPAADSKKEQSKNEETGQVSQDMLDALRNKFRRDK